MKWSVGTRVQETGRNRAQHLWSCGLACQVFAGASFILILPSKALASPQARRRRGEVICPQITCQQGVAPRVHACSRQATNHPDGTAFIKEKNESVNWKEPPLWLLTLCHPSKVCLSPNNHSKAFFSSHLKFPLSSLTCYNVLTSIYTPRSPPIYSPSLETLPALHFHPACCLSTSHPAESISGQQNELTCTLDCVSPLVKAFLGSLWPSGWYHSFPILGEPLLTLQGSVENSPLPCTLPLRLDNSSYYYMIWLPLSLCFH